jgi:hypothetical protein
MPRAGSWKAGKISNYNNFRKLESWKLGSKNFHIIHRLEGWKNPLPKFSNYNNFRKLELELKFYFFQNLY